MRIFVVCHNAECQAKIYITSKAKEKRELKPQYRLKCLRCGESAIFSREEVLAEMSAISGSGVAIVSGFFGVLAGGPIGGVVGAAGGGTIGVGIERRDRNAVERFNES